MASFRALVLVFVTDYLARWGQSPSYGEIAAGLGSNRERVRNAVLSLVKSGLLARTPGPRGLALPSEIERARELLVRAARLPGPSSLTAWPLLPAAVLDYSEAPARRKRRRRK